MRNSRESARTVRVLWPVDLSQIPSSSVSDTWQVPPPQPPLVEGKKSPRKGISTIKHYSNSKTLAMKGGTAASEGQPPPPPPQQPPLPQPSITQQFNSQLTAVARTHNQLTENKQSGQLSAANPVQHSSFNRPPTASAASQSKERAVAASAATAQTQSDKSSLRVQSQLNDYRVEVEKKFQVSSSNKKYVFPRAQTPSHERILDSDEEEGQSSLSCASMEGVTIYNLHSQNEVRYINHDYVRASISTSATSTLPKRHQTFDSPESHRQTIAAGPPKKKPLVQRQNTQYLKTEGDEDNQQSIVQTRLKERLDSVVRLHSEPSQSSREGGINGSSLQLVSVKQPYTVTTSLGGKVVIKPSGQTLMAVNSQAYSQCWVSEDKNARSRERVNQRSLHSQIQMTSSSGKAVARKNNSTHVIALSIDPASKCVTEASPKNKKIQLPRQALIENNSAISSQKVGYFRIPKTLVSSGAKVRKSNHHSAVFSSSINSGATLRRNDDSKISSQMMTITLTSSGNQNHTKQSQQQQPLAATNLRRLDSNSKNINSSSFHQASSQRVATEGELLTMQHKKNIYGQQQTLTDSVKRTGSGLSVSRDRAGETLPIKLQCVNTSDQLEFVMQNSVFLQKNLHPKIHSKNNIKTTLSVRQSANHFLSQFSAVHPQNSTAGDVELSIPTTGMKPSNSLPRQNIKAATAYGSISKQKRLKTEM